MKLVFLWHTSINHLPHTHHSKLCSNYVTNDAHLGILETLDKDGAWQLKLSSWNTSFFTLPPYIQFYHMWSPPGFNSCSSTLLVNLQLLLLYNKNTFGPKKLSLSMTCAIWVNYQLITIILVRSSLSSICQWHAVEAFQRSCVPLKHKNDTTMRIPLGIWMSFQVS